MSSTALHLRAFPVSPEDLDVPLDQGTDPRAVTTILARCLSRPDGGLVDPRVLWGLDVGARIEWLLRIAALNGPAFDVQVRCGNPGCGEALALELTIEELIALRTGEQGPVVAEVNGEPIVFRPPTGADQLAWLERPYADATEATASLAASLMLGGGSDRLDSAALESLELALAERDRLVQFSVSAVCPRCGAENEHEVDLVDLAVRRLRTARDKLIGEVHLLASRYHWGEADVLAMPSWRRAHYLALCERDVGGGR